MDDAPGPQHFRFDHSIDLVIMITIMMILMAEVCPSEVSEGKLEVEVEGQLGWEGIQGHKEQVPC